MSTPEAKRTRAAQLYLMAADAFARDNCRATNKVRIERQSG